MAKEHVPADDGVHRREWILGLDIGSRSIGWAALAAGEDLKPTGELLDAGVYIHDGGILDDSKGITRHQKRGEVVRSRRRLRRRRSRRRSLAEVLRSNGIVRQSGWRERNPWWSRSLLAVEPVADPARVRHLAAIAIEHIARHRGWRNPWLPAPEPVAEPVPEDLRKAFDEMSEWAGEQGLDAPPAPVLGVMSWTVLGWGGSVRHSSKEKDRDENRPGIEKWLPKVLQEHIAAELATIWKVQSRAHPDLFTDELLKDLTGVVLHQEKPGVPLENVGPCELQPHLYRAPKASPLFQRYRLLSTIANLRIRTPDGELTLDDSQRETVFDLLDGPERLDWAVVADAIGVDPADLRTADAKGTAGKAPNNQIVEKLEGLEAKGPDWRRFREWWKEASDDKRELVVGMAIGDRVIEDEHPEELKELADEIDELGWFELVEKFGRALPPGRARFSRLVLSDLNRQMDAGADLHLATEETYGSGAVGAHVTWETEVPNAGVELSMKRVRQIVDELAGRYGDPSAIGVEIVRDAAMSHQERQDRQNRIKREREARDKVREILKADYGMESPSDADIAKREHLTAQQGICLYCGKVLARLPDVELDHIVPRSTGGSTIWTNLAAVCRPCNERKGNRPFGAWASDGGAPRSLEDVLADVDKMRSDRWREVPKKPYINPDNGRWVISDGEKARREIKSRLRKTEREREFDGADLQHTAFIARAVRERLESRFGGDVKVRVHRGATTAALRRETGLSKILGGGTVKDRGDRRHHAVDAIAMALLVDDKWAWRVRVRDEAYSNHRYELIPWSWVESTRERADISELQVEVDRLVDEGAAVMDQVIPVIQRRLVASGRVHEDTISEWGRRRVGDAWGRNEIVQVRDDAIRTALWQATGRGGKLPADPDRVLVVEGATGISELGPNDEIEVAGERVWIPVRNGWAKSAGLHHARIVKVDYARNGRRESAIELVSVPVVDVYRRENALSFELSPDSVALRSHPRLSAFLAASDDVSVRQLVSLLAGDVIEHENRFLQIVSFDVSDNAKIIICRHALSGGEGVKSIKVSPKQLIESNARLYLRGAGASPLHVVEFGSLMD